MYQKKTLQKEHFFPIVCANSVNILTLQTEKEMNGISGYQGITEPQDNKNTQGSKV